jgi:transposase
VVRPVEVHSVQVYELVRRSVLVQGKSINQVSSDLGLDWRTVKKMVSEPVPPGYRLSSPREKPRLGPYLEKIQEMLEVDETAPGKQRHTASHIFARLKKEFGYEGGETQVRAYVSELRSRPKEAFVPLVSIPGEAESDFKESTVEIAGKRVTAHCFLSVLPQSGVWFCACYPKENAESFADGHSRAFKFFGGVPRRSVYDNAGYSVKRGSGPITGRERSLTDSFTELQSRYLFEAVFANTYSGNEKGSVERKVRIIRSRLFVPVPKADSWEELNKVLYEQALKAKLASERFPEDAAKLLPAPDWQPERLVSAKVDKLSLVCFETCFYSVPTQFVGRKLTVKARPFALEIFSDKERIAQHTRCFERGRYVTDYAHYLDLLERKPRAVRCALPVLQAGFPEEFESFRQRVDDNTSAGDRRFVAVLRLASEFGVDKVQAALAIALARGVREPADIRLLVIRQFDEIPANFKWESTSGAASPSVERPSLSEYSKLLVVAA